jgi:hypothetical protein
MQASGTFHSLPPVTTAFCTATARLPYAYRAWKVRREIPSTNIHPPEKFQIRQAQTNSKLKLELQSTRRLNREPREKRERGGCEIRKGLHEQTEATEEETAKG